FVICTSYSQLIETVPAGGGAYVVASKLLNPSAGVVAGCALLIDYVLTIAVSIASGADALFSFLPASWQAWKLAAALGGVLVLIVLNLRGVKESVLVCLPIFFTFVVTHGFAMIYTLVTHLGGMSGVAGATLQDVRAAHTEIGLGGILLLILRAYSQGAGTYTGIEAVSNAMPMLREPRVETGKRTMTYMAVSLAVTVAGLPLAYPGSESEPSGSEQLNAVLVEERTGPCVGPTSSL